MNTSQIGKFGQHGAYRVPTIRAISNAGAKGFGTQLK
jgi:hypothetical protein